MKTGAQVAALRADLKTADARRGEPKAAGKAHRKLFRAEFSPATASPRKSFDSSSG